MEKTVERYLSFLRFAIADNAPEPDAVSDIDWNDLLQFATKQTIVGVMFHGINKLSPQGPNRPDKYAVAAWFANNAAVVEQNRQTNEDAAKAVFYFYKKFNVKTCVLKGQANALMYPDPYMRMSGDIDLWTDQDTIPLLKHVMQMEPDAEIGYHHVALSNHGNTPIEVHFVPSFMGNLFYERRLRAYFNRVKAEQFKKMMPLPGNAGYICVPTDSFSRIFQISHIMHHFFFEGVGLRQLIDYYYLLKRGFTDAEREADVALLRSLNMFRFSAGVMWVMHEVLGLDRPYLLMEPDEGVGQLLLREMLKAGNFGHHDTRYSFKGKTVYTQYFIEIYRNLHFALMFPSETVWGRPLSRWWHMGYKAWLRYRLKHA